jgi:hypothetical protein
MYDPLPPSEVNPDLIEAYARGFMEGVAADKSEIDFKLRRVEADRNRMVRALVIAGEIMEAVGAWMSGDADLPDQDWFDAKHEQLHALLSND